MKRLLTLIRERDLLRRALAVTLACILMATAFALGIQATQETPFDPLRLPVQKVENRIKGELGPAVRNGEDVHVFAYKCNESNVSITVSGTVVWQSVEPPGSVFEVSTNSTSERPPGCSPPMQYINPMPPEVSERNRELFEEGYAEVTWEITGVETPLNYKAVVSRAWVTETFTVLP